MSAYEHALIVDEHSSEQRLAAAARMLERCAGLVLLPGAVALRPMPQAIRCEVIDPTPHAHRCAEEFLVLIENAAHFLANSALAPRLPVRPLHWIVVDDRQSGALQLWPQN